MRQIAFSFFKIIILFSLVACSEEESEKVDASFIPSNPNVNFYDSNIFLYTDTVTSLPVSEPIDGPWFRFKMEISNSSAKTVVVSNLTLKLTGVSAIEGIISAEAEFSASDLVENKQPLPNPDPAAAQAITVVLANETKTTSYFYVTNLPEAVVTGVFNVEVTATGWFGTVDVPTDRFEQKYFFTTN
jgi:hypothetical protein